MRSPDPFADFGPHPGYVGAFTRAQALGAWRNGTRVRKIAADAGGDRTPNGTEGIVLGSVQAPDQAPIIFYFVAWDTAPETAVGCVSWKLEAIARE